MNDRKIRKANVEGHRRKFLVVVDDSAECELAVYFSALRARRMRKHTWPWLIGVLA